MNKRFWIFTIFTLIAGTVVFEPLKVFMSSPRQELYSHILLIPLVSGSLLFRNRRKIFGNDSCFSPYGIGLLCLGAAAYGLAYFKKAEFDQNDYASLILLSGIILWVGAFAGLYGAKVLRVALFPILFLVFMVPIPNVLMGKIIYGLQIGSTEAAEILFTLTGVPFQREGFLFHLPGISVEVADVCSGIRSSLALFITGVLAGHLFLDRFWKKLFLALLVFPVTILKNGLRITTLSLLGAYVDERWLTQSFLHHSGGFVFFIPALGIMAGALWILRATERKRLGAKG